MKKKTILPIVFLLTSCALPEHKPTVPLDTETVRIYNEKIKSVNTNSDKQKKSAVKEVDIPLNASDKQENSRNSRRNIVVMPSVGYYHHYPHHHYYW